MKVSIDNSSQIIKMRLNVEKFDVSNMQEIKKELQNELEKKAQDVLIDLSPVSFVDSSGLSVLIAIFKQLNASKHKMQLCGLQEQPMELLEITQLHKVFTLINSCPN